MKIGVVINTYHRSDGRSKEFLIRSLTSVKNQTHEDFKVYLIGDNYDNEEEFIEISRSILPSSKIYYENLSYAKERDKYISGDKLWCSGGVNARNYGIEVCLKDGIGYICNLDHDDQWLPNHLSSINNIITNYNYNFLSTRCNYRNLYLVPKSLHGEFFPIPGDITHSATCINFSRIPLRYRDVFEESGIVYPADADLWIRIKDYMIANNQIGYLIDDVTVIFDKKERD